MHGRERRRCRPRRHCCTPNTTSNHANYHRNFITTAHHHRNFIITVQVISRRYSEWHALSRALLASLPASRSFSNVFPRKAVHWAPCEMAPGGRHDPAIVRHRATSLRVWLEHVLDIPPPQQQQPRGLVITHCGGDEGAASCSSDATYPNAAGATYPNAAGATCPNDAGDTYRRGAFFVSGGTMVLSERADHGSNLGGAIDNEGDHGDYGESGKVLRRFLMLDEPPRC